MSLKAHVFLTCRQQPIQERKPDGIKHFPSSDLVGLVGFDELRYLQEAQRIPKSGSAICRSCYQKKCGHSFVVRLRVPKKFKATIAIHAGPVSH